MNISIENYKLTIKNFEKKLNIHLQIMKYLTYPYRYLKGLIKGMTFRYYKLNSRVEDFK